MSVVQPSPFGVFVNFTAASRKPLLIPSMFFSPGDSTAWIWSPLTGVASQQYTLIGTIDGANRVFTTPVPITASIQVFRNGILLDPQAPWSSYVVTGGNTVTFANAPEVGDDLNAFIA